MKTHFLSLIVFLGVSNLALADWSNFQGPKLDGTSPERGLKLSNWGDGPTVLWKTTLNKGFGGAAISGDDVFIVDRKDELSDELICLNLKDGSENRRFSHVNEGKLPFPGSRGVPYVATDSVYFIGGFGVVYRINRETMKADWIVDIRKDYQGITPGWGWAQSPVIVGDILVVPAMSNEIGLIGLDIKTGKERWKTEGFGSSHSTPTVLNLHGVEQLLFVGSKHEGEVGTTISVEPATGKVLWKTNEYYNKYPIPFPTKVTEDLVFLTGGYEAGSRMIRVTKDWKVENVFTIERGSQIHPPFVIGKHLYFLANENATHKGKSREKGGLTCMDFDGKIIWNTGDKPFMGRGNMIYADGKLLIQDGEVGYLRVVDPSPSGYKEVAMADIFGKKAEVDSQIEAQKGRDQIKLPDLQYWSPMALSNGHLILRGQENLVCVKLK